MTANECSVSFFLPTLTPGGIERVFLTLTRGFANKGYSTNLIVADFRGEFIDEIPKNVNIVDLEVDRTAKSLVPLVKYLRRSHPDVLISGHDHANIVASLAGKLSLSDTKIAVGIHSLRSQKKRNDGRLNYSPTHSILTPFSYYLANFILPVSRAASEELNDGRLIDEDKIHVIPNPVDIDTILSSDYPPNHPWFSNNRIILGVGRLVPDKGYDDLIRAFDILSDNMNDLRLVLLGDGFSREELESLAGDFDLYNKIDFVGYVHNPYPYICSADLLVQPSRHEGFSMTLVEAMACGTPVVATDCPGGPAEILEKGKYGPLVPVGDPNSLADAIDSQLQNPTDSKQLIARASDFSVGTVVDQYESLLFS